MACILFGDPGFPIRWSGGKRPTWFPVECPPYLLGYEPTQWWESLPATEPQIKYLLGMGFDVATDITRGEACYLLDFLVPLLEDHPPPATPQQRWLLERHGQWEDGLSKSQARHRIARI